MSKAYIFPGQGSQFIGMGKELYDNNPKAYKLFEQANNVLGFRITDIMFHGTDEELMQTRVTQPAVFLHSVITALCLEDFSPNMVAGHSLGEFSALVVAGALSFENGLELVYSRAIAMQEACDMAPSTMAAVIALPDETIERICNEISTDGNIVVAANYNCPGQVVISGNIDAVKKACNRLKEAGAKRAIQLAVNGAFHSPCMEPARQKLAVAIEKTTFNTPICPIYQNVDALPHTNPEEIKANLLQQLTSAVRWSQEVKNMIADGAEEFIECGPGKILTGLIAKIQKTIS